MKLLFDENLSPNQQRSLLYGYPPKLIWLRLGNCTTEKIVRLLTAHEQAIRTFDSNPLEAVLVLSPQQMGEDGQ